MAGIAGHRRVRTDQREACRVLLDRFHTILPALDRVAIFAFGTKLAAMDVGVAIRALGPNIAENQLGVAQTALHLLMHAAQCKTGFAVVVKLGNSTDRRPTRGGVTAAAGGLQRRPVRIARGAALHFVLPLAGGSREARKREEEQRQDDVIWG